MFRNCFARIYVFSPSINVDGIWIRVMQDIEDEMTVGTEKEQCFLKNISHRKYKKFMERHHKVIEYQQNNDQ